MTFALAHFTYELMLALGICDRVMARDGLMFRPGFVKKAVLGRLRTGIRAKESFLRRILILMALEIEHDLVVVERPLSMARAKAKKLRLKKPIFVIFPAFMPQGQFDFYQKCAPPARPLSFEDAITSPPVLVPVSYWLDRLDSLKAIAKDPIAKARRLAFSIARCRHGIFMAPKDHPRLLRRWGTEASALHDAMGYQIIEQSRIRPPPLRPPRRGLKPRITLLSWGPV